MTKRRIIVMILIIIVFIVSIILSVLYYNNKISVTFDTGKNEDIIVKYVKIGNKVSIPSTPKRDGYVFIEWQYNGKKFDFNTNLKYDMVLTANWMKKEYITVSYSTDSNYNIDPIKILKGSKITNLPVSYKDGFDFIGWSLNGSLYDNNEVYSDSTLIATYNKKKIDYKIGDVVIINGNYSSSAFNINADYDAALGWQRQILDIYENTNFPYMIGNENGITGFFNYDSIKLEGE